MSVRRRRANLEGNAGAVHVVVVADGGSKVYHGVFIGAIEGTEGGGVFALVGAEADGEGAFVIGVEIQGMELSSLSHYSGRTAEEIAEGNR